MLIAFEVLIEAGLRLPKNIGQLFNCKLSWVRRC